MKATQRNDQSTITVVQARKIAKYTHMTYFKHLRLYDFVLQSNKSSDSKWVTVPTNNPKIGAPLVQAQTLSDKITKIYYEPDEEQQQEQPVASTKSGASLCLGGKSLEKEEDGSMRDVSEEE